MHPGLDGDDHLLVHGVVAVLAVRQRVVHRLAQYLFRVLRHRGATAFRRDAHLDVPQQVAQTGIHELQHVVHIVLFVLRDPLRQVHITMHMAAKAKPVSRMVSADQRSQYRHAAVLEETPALQECPRRRQIRL